MEDSVMRKTLSVLPFLAFGTLIAPLQAIAQTQQQPMAPPKDYYWPGPWHMMWGWGMFPMMLLFFILFFRRLLFRPRLHGWDAPVGTTEFMG
jgi:hypothetical protein